MSNIEVELLKVAEAKISKGKWYSADGNGNFVEIAPYLLMINTIEMFYTALDIASKEYGKVFHMNIKETNKEKMIELIDRKKKRVDKILKDVDKVTEQSILDMIELKFNEQSNLIKNSLIPIKNTTIQQATQQVQHPLELETDYAQEETNTPITIGGITFD